MIQVNDLGKSYDGGKSWAVRGASFHVAEGQLLVLIGRSGCGKTSTLKMLNRLIEPSEGHVIINGDDTCELNPIELRRRIGYVFQNFGLFPHMTIEENLEIVPRLLGWEKEQRRSRAAELLDLVNLDPPRYRDRYPSELSGGQLQRVGFARALAAKPALMLLDEPFGALDIITREELSEEFKRIQRELNLTAVMVTHDVMIALQLADKLGVMHDGELLQCDKPKVLIHNPAHPYVTKLLERSARIWELAKS